MSEHREKYLENYLCGPKTVRHFGLRWHILPEALNHQPARQKIFKYTYQNAKNIFESKIEILRHAR